MTSITTILAEIVTAEGTAAWHDAWAGPGIRTRQATPPSTFGRFVDGSVEVRIRHDGPTVGYLDYLEHGLGHGNGAMFGVATIRGVPFDMIDGQVFCSPEIAADALARTVNTDKYSNGTMRSSTKVVGSMHATHASLEHIALVDQTAGDTSTKVRAWPGDYRDPLDRGRWQQRTIPPIIERAIKAAATNLRWNRPEQLRIHRIDDHDSAEHRNEGSGQPARMRMIDGVLTEIHYHGGGRVLSVR